MILCLLWVFTQPFNHKQEVRKGQFLSGVQLVWIQRFPSLRLVTIPRLKISGFPTIYSKLMKRRNEFVLFLKTIDQVKFKHPCPGFEPCLLSLFLRITTVMLHMTLVCLSKPSSKTRMSLWLCASHARLWHCSEFSCALIFIFRLILLGKVWTPLYP